MTNFDQGQTDSRPLMSVDALQQLENQPGRTIPPAERGRKPRLIDGDDRQTELVDWYPVTVIPEDNNP